MKNNTIFDFRICKVVRLEIAQDLIKQAECERREFELAKKAAWFFMATTVVLILLIAIFL